MSELTRWVIRDIGMGWFAICDKGLDGKGHAQQLARAFAGRAEIVRDALEAAWPLEDVAPRDSAFSAERADQKDGDVR